MSTATTPLVSPVTARAVELVASRRPVAEALGRSLADHVNDPEAFAGALRGGLDELADPEYLAGQQRVAPGIGLIHGVRWPLLAAVGRTFRAATRADRPAAFLYLADRLFREPHLEARWFAFGLLERTLEEDPERTWQLLRRGAREAGDWITVDTLARPFGRGVLAEAYRWAELEQLVFSPSRWERRLVGSTIATIPHVDRRRGREGDVVDRSLALLEQLLGDSEPDVQKSLSWALRTMAAIDRDAVTAFVRVEAERAVTSRDGHRAWVIRDTLARLDPAVAEDVRGRLAGVRKAPGAPSTSPAAATAARFGRLPDPAGHPEPPLT